MSNRGVEKRHVKETIYFVIENIPNIQAATLELYLDMVLCGDQVEAVTEDQLLDQRDLLVGFVPTADAHSVNVVLKQLDLPSMQCSQVRYQIPTFVDHPQPNEDRHKRK